MKRCIEAFGSFPADDVSKQFAFPGSETGMVVGIPHLPSLSECLVGELGKRGVGSECQIQVAVCQSAVGSRVASARKQPLGLAIQGMKPALQKHLTVGRTIATALHEFAIVVPPCF